MGSAPASLAVKLPRSGSVPRNAAIVLEGRVFGALSVTATHGDDDIPVTLDSSFPLGGGGHSYWLVRPSNGEWPTTLLRSKVTLRAAADSPSATIEVPIGARDDYPPELSWLAPPEEGTTLTPWDHRQFLRFEYGPVNDAAGPFVRGELELADGRTHSVAFQEGHAGSFHFDRDSCRDVDAITLTDLAGNSCRIAHPTRRAIPARPMPDLTDWGKGSFKCVAGSLEAVNTLGAFIATSDASTTNGLSRGHFVSIRPELGDVDISVKMRRLTVDGGMPVEIAFRGGFFGVSAYGQWYLHERDDHWTGWKPMPESSRRPSSVLELRVIQRGQHVSGYINNELAGDFTLDAAPTSTDVGIGFKGTPGEPSRIRFHDFFVKAPR
ncbi:MAG: hypothetical protein H0T46_16085 [Deltaproteobacteria bacterium]|nr:hypothetical protein [Deltaproteobacteria bacterium]